LGLRVLTISGMIVKYDSDDMWLVEGKSWCLNKGNQNRGWYVMHSVREGKRVRKDYLHRLVAGAKKGDKVEFITEDTLDCRKSNLRLNGRRLESGH